MILILFSGLTGLIVRGATAALTAPARPHAVVVVPPRLSAKVAA